MKRALLIAVVPVTLVGCVASPGPVRPTLVPDRAPIAFTGVGLERVMGQSAPTLISLLGQPDADVREGDAHKLQFHGPICVLDTYLYTKSGHDPVVTYVDARQPDGRAIDRASCVAALTRRAGGK